jgi:hypothetical protein
LRLSIDIFFNCLYIIEAMGKFTRSLKNKLNLLLKELGENSTFTVADAVGVLKAKETTVRWVLWNLCDKGKIVRIGKGLYTFRSQVDQKSLPHLSTAAKEVKKIFDEEGLEFFISGLDILAGYMTHIPEKYPVLVFVEKENIDEANELLKGQNIDSIIGDKVTEYKKIYRILPLIELIILRPTREFDYSKDGIAEPEKAFVDLYYEVTRASFPLSLEELGRIFLNMQRRIFINEKRLSKVAIRRNLHHDIRYILNYKRISPHAFEFADILTRLERE